MIHIYNFVGCHCYTRESFQRAKGKEVQISPISTKASEHPNLYWRSPDWPEVARLASPVVVYRSPTPSQEPLGSRG